MFDHYFLCLGSEDTLSFFLPLARLLARTFLPLTVDMRSLNPCLFLRFRFDGWNVLFISLNPCDVKSCGHPAHKILGANIQRVFALPNGFKK